MNANELIAHFRVNVHRWNLAEAADRLGMSKDTLRRRETGESDLTLTELESIAAVYGIPLERLFGLEPVCADCGGHNVILRRVKP